MKTVVVSHNPSVPAQPGTYALFLACLAVDDIQVGRLGILKTRPGIYVYIGSAHGPGGLRARLNHHCRTSPKPRWHIDYLRANLKPVSAWITCDPIRREHQWAKGIGQTRGAGLVLARFGASDCRCRAHLFHFAVMPSLATFRKKIQRHFHGHGPISSIPL